MCLSIGITVDQYGWKLISLVAIYATVALSRFTSLSSQPMKCGTDNSSLGSYTSNALSIHDAFESV